MTDIALGIVISFFLVCVLILFCAILIQIYVIKVKKHHKEIIKQKENEQEAVNTSILETQREAFNNISSLLHDDLGQKLTVLNLQLEGLKITKPENRSEYEELSEQVKRVAFVIRDLSHVLNTPPINDVGLLKAIEKELQRVNALGFLKTEFTIKGNRNDYFFTEEESIILYRSLQEIMNNTIKHAKASDFMVMLSQSNQPHFIFKDNGEGKPIVTSNGMGITNMSKRCAIIGYDFEVKSQKQHGTQIIIQKK